MNIHHVVLVFLCCVCVCVCATNSTVRVVANQTTENPGNCNLSNCPSSCTRVFFSERDSTCVFLQCDDNVTCDHFIAELGSKAIDAQKNGADLLQLILPPPKSPLSPSPTALPVSQSASAAPISPPAPPSVPDRKQSSASRNSSDSSFNSNTSRSSQDGDQGQIQNNSTTDRKQAEVPNKTLQNGTLVQVLNNSLPNERQPPIKPSSPAPTSPPVPIAFVGAENTSLTTPKDQTGTQVNKTGQETTTTTTTSDKSALPTNSTALPSTTFITTAITRTTTSTTTPTTSTTSKVTSPPSTTQTRPTSTPTSIPPSPAPPFLPSVTPSSRPPGQNLSTTTPKVPNVTSDLVKAIVETAGGKFSSHLVNTSSLIAILIFGLLFFIVTVILFLRHAYESYKRRGYTQMDYLINGMYSDSGL